jgi:hypothetical protein
MKGKEFGVGGVGMIDQAQGGDKWWAVLKDNEASGPVNGGEFLH